MIRCPYCDRPMDPRGDKTALAETTDHIVPRSRRDLWQTDYYWMARNAIPVCRECNSRKSSTDPLVWLILIPEERCVAPYARRLQSLGFEQSAVVAAISARTLATQAAKMYVADVRKVLKAARDAETGEANAEL